MFVSIDLCLVPIGVGTSLSPYIKECIEVIKNEGLKYELGANGTAIEGDWDKAVSYTHLTLPTKRSV